MSTIPKRRERVKRHILESKARKELFGDWICEAQVYIPHDCRNGFHMNEVLFPRGVFQKLPASAKLYFFHPINCSIVCGWFHENYGHSRAYREWYEKQMRMLYTDENVDKWIANVPLKIRRGR